MNYLINNIVIKHCVTIFNQNIFSIMNNHWSRLLRMQPLIVTRSLVSRTSISRIISSTDNAQPLLANLKPLSNLTSNLASTNIPSSQSSNIHELLNHNRAVASGCQASAAGGAGQAPRVGQSTGERLSGGSRASRLLAPQLGPTRWRNELQRIHQLLMIHPWTQFEPAFLVVFRCFGQRVETQEAMETSMKLENADQIEMTATVVGWMLHPWQTIMKHQKWLAINTNTHTHTNQPFLSITKQYPWGHYHILEVISHRHHHAPTNHH